MSGILFTFCQVEFSFKTHEHTFCTVANCDIMLQPVFNTNSLRRRCCGKAAPTAISHVPVQAYWKSFVSVVNFRRRMWTYRVQCYALHFLADRCNATFGYCHEMSSVCLSSVTRVYCGQTVSWIRMPLGTTRNVVGLRVAIYVQRV